MRRPTHADAELLIHLYELRRDPELRRARQWFLTEFKAASWTEIKMRYLTHTDEDRHFRMTTSYWEMVASVVNRGVLHAELFFDHTGEDIVTWERCRPWIAEAREDIRPTYLYQFERLVEAHQEYRKSTIARFVASRTSTEGAATTAGGAAPARRAGRSPGRANGKTSRSNGRTTGRAARGRTTARRG